MKRVICVADLVVLGSDHPFPWDPASGEWVHGNKHMNARSKQKILWANGFRWLGIDPAPYVPTPRTEKAHL